MKLRKNDNVVILTGKDHGKRGKIIDVLPEVNRVVVEGLNLRKKHMRPRRAGEKGQIIESPASLPVSRVALVCPHCQKTIRVGYRKAENGDKQRWCRKCQAAIIP